ncbi:unnamed protein product [Didymodactylos carnosus]|uniref:Carrier domain-containing protein n=1 Tax=Didymodactylos carnosus TaxID=1234261 RepID=A0A814VLV1_9BILA|nr:unnamed protein product [Didymodactylos carnosus]CAF1544792.1 unnamed protein product [Didymodactylos carnosus]CAF3953191.1 unnamed protein product [Didymodactylos carnosus]CAF4333592.1 unnamed protein product [Didymodactylos carnosus]
MRPNVLNRTYYIGSLINDEMVESNVRFTQELIHQYFNDSHENTMDLDNKLELSTSMPNINKLDYILKQIRIDLPSIADNDDQKTLIQYGLDSIRFIHLHTLLQQHLKFDLPADELSSMSVGQLLHYVQIDTNNDKKL